MPDWDEVIAICEAELPEVDHSTSYGTPALKVRGKLFCRLREDEVQIVVFCDFMEREALLQSDPDAFQVTPHYQEWPMVLITLAAVASDELFELLIESWRRRAPKRLLAAYDEAGED